MDIPDIDQNQSFTVIVVPNVGMRKVGKVTVFDREQFIVVTDETEDDFYGTLWLASEKEFSHQKVKVPKIIKNIEIHRDVNKNFLMGWLNAQSDENDRLPDKLKSLEEENDILRHLVLTFYGSQVLTNNLD